ncbi:MAG: Sapep family Mn(2+)-dependent dipeptidase [Oscillospiraceae bacterium]|nr:Sapep family Mn(2+)-dependent dipeptidase [Oscillospiraceae bacterium]
MQYQEQIHAWLAAHEAELLADLTQLISIRSVQGAAQPDAPFGEEPARALGTMLEFCEKYGFSTDNVEWYAGSADLNEKASKLGVLAHLDVVPEGEGWLHDPYQMTYEPETDKLIGRGTSDDKGPAMAALYAMRAVKELQIPMAHGVRLILGADEENGSADLAYYMQKRTLPPMVFTPDGDYPVITLEKGMLRLRLTADFTDGRSQVVSLRAGETVNAVPAAAEAVVRGVSLKTFLATRVKDYPGTVIASREEDGLLHIIVDGRNAHASTPEQGKNALTLLLELLSALPLGGEQGKTIRRLSELYPYGETDGTALGIAASDEISGALTLVMSVIEMDENDMTAWNDIRFPVCTTGETIIKKLKQTVSPVSVETVLCDAPHHTDENSPFVRTLLHVYEAVTEQKGKCLAIGGGTYVHHIEGGVAFGATFPGEDVNMHGAEEFIRKSHLLLDAEMMALAMIELCKG